MFRKQSQLSSGLRRWVDDPPLGPDDLIHYLCNISLLSPSGASPLPWYPWVLLTYKRQSRVVDDDLSETVSRCPPILYFPVVRE